MTDTQSNAAAHTFDKTAKVFVHTIRPAILGEFHPKQRYFGASRSANYTDLADIRGESIGRADTFRFHDEDHANVRIFLGSGATAMGMVGLNMGPQALRELARVLIDAAHDIEANPASALMAAAADAAAESERAA